MKILGIEFDKKFRNQYLIASVIASFGGFFIYAFQHNKYNFKFEEILLQIPLVFFVVFILALIFGSIINYGVVEE